MKKCGWCLRRNNDDARMCLCGWPFPTAAGRIAAWAVRYLTLATATAEKTPANDISFWQRRPDGPQHNFRQMSTRSRGVWIRCCQGRRVDRDFKTNYAGARGKIARGAYVYLDFSCPPAEQVDLMFETMGDEVGELAPWLDWEEWGNAPSPGTARLMLRAAIERAIWHLQQRDWNFERQKLGLYTANGYWLIYGSPDQYWADKCDLMIAHYGVLIPRIPAPWKVHRVHQWGFGNGPDHGVQSLEIDMDDFNGGPAAWDAYALPLPGIELPPPVGYIDMRFFVITNNLAIRSEPSTARGNATVLRRVSSGSIFVGVDSFAPASGGEAWVKNAAGEWACIAQGGAQHMRTV